jgi:hypothetical protein
MKTTVSLSELRGLDERAHGAKLAALSSALTAEPNGELRDVEQEIERRAVKVGVPAAEVRARVAAGTLRETREVCDLLMLLTVRDHLGAAQARPR